MVDIVKLREKMEAQATEARAELDKITPEMSEGDAKEHEARFDTAMAEYDRLRAQVEREERLQKAREDLEKGDPRAPSYDDDKGGEDRSKDGDKREYLAVFEKAVRFGMQELDAEERKLVREFRDQQVTQKFEKENRALTSTTGSSGGYTVPEEWANEIDKQLAIWGPMWDAEVCRELNTSNGRKINWPTINDTANTGRIKAQNAAVDDDGTDDPAFGTKELDAYIFDTGMIRVPIELMEDSMFDIQSLLAELLGERLGRLGNSVLTTADGSGTAQGIVPAAAVGDTAAAVAAVTSDELMDFQVSVNSAYRQSPKCRWQFNDNTFNVIRKLKDGQGNYLWNMGDVRSGDPSMLLGKPYSINAAMANMAASARPIIFGDHSRFVVRKVRGFQMITLRERFAENFQIGVVAFKRFDSELLNDQAVKALEMAAV